MLKKIEIKKEVSFPELEKRLRNVKLRGFPHINIYEDCEIKIDSFIPKEVKGRLFTPQPSVYRPELKRVSGVAEIFLEQGIDIFKLNGGFDYFAFDEKGEETMWTIIPPVIEILPIGFNAERGLDYSKLVGEELMAVMKEKGYELNPELQDLDFAAYKQFKGTIAKVPEICDGSHRIEVAYRKGTEQSLLLIDSPKPGFPYYAAPKPYDSVHEEPERIEEKLDKTHVLTAPGHKFLYRLFPSGGINSGALRPRKEKFD